jgi:endonuclease YncB( thermonuclease family)
MTNLTRFAALSLALIFSAPALALTADFPICGSGKRITCVVDGDTVWFGGVKYRFEEIDTPEKGDLAECMQEGLQAIEATKRLAEILSTHEFRIERSGSDRYRRVLARFRIGMTTAGEMLISEWSGAALAGQDGRLVRRLMVHLKRGRKRTIALAVISLAAGACFRGKSPLAAIDSNDDPSPPCAHHRCARPYRCRPNRRRLRSLD